MPGLYTGATGLWGGFAGLLYGSSALSTPPGLLADAAWSPAQLFAQGEQGAWYDPSDLSTMFQDAAGTTPVTAVEQPVGRILDKSGRGNHATQSTSASRPVLKQDANGKYYLLFDGTNDFLVTGTINPGAVDKAQVFAGVRKLSDAAIGVLVEISANLNSNNGTFFMAAPISASGANYAFLSKGTIATSRTVSGFTAPVSSVVTGIGDIGAPSVSIRVNSGSFVTSNSTQGTGNYLSYPLYIGRRGGTSLPFNGHLYSLIVRFGANLPDATIAQTETWVNGKTGAY